MPDDAPMLCWPAASQPDAARPSPHLRTDRRLDSLLPPPHLVIVSVRPLRAHGGRSGEAVQFSKSDANIAITFGCHGWDAYAPNLPRDCC